MTTPDPRCKPPANNIIEPLTFTTDEMALRGKMVLSQSDFLHLASSSMFSINNYMYEKSQVTHKKRENMRNAGVKGFWRASRPKCKPNRFDLVIAKLQLKLVIACIF